MKISISRMMQVSERTGKIFYLSICIIIVIIFIDCSAHAGKLDNFEKDFERENRGKEDTQKCRKSGDSCAGCLGDVIGDILFSILCGNGPTNSHIEWSDPAYDAYMKEESKKRKEKGVREKNQRIEDSLAVRKAPIKEREPRELGYPLSPFFRIDIGYQNVESDIYATDSRIEGGYGLIGAQFRKTVYMEDTPSDELSITHIHALSRILFGGGKEEVLEIDMGIGASIINGDNTNSGISFSSALLFYPLKIVGFEFRPCWSSINDNSLSDYDMGLLFNWLYVSLRIGYRWVESENESLNGSYVGFSFRL
ncbi:MAG: hypothetical protein ACMUJM_24605 [bacterium]